MDKNALKKFAVWARTELIARTSLRAQRCAITPASTPAPGTDSIDGRVLSPAERRQLQALIRRITANGFKQTIEEAAYTWFNRFIALRYMEANSCLPSHVRIFTDGNGRFKPQILAEASHVQIDGLDTAKVFALKEADRDEELFRYLLITQCNALSPILPGMFQKIEDWTELLLPDRLLEPDNVPAKMAEMIPEDDWHEVQVIGWLYQYYNTELKNQVFADLKRNIKIDRNTIPPATQLFTPDWIVRYMVQNSLGRLWLEGHPNADLQSSWQYYIPEAQQTPGVLSRLQAVRRELSALNPEDIRCIDPCCGSGHILAAMFDVLVQIYGTCGYSIREAVRLIVAQNIWGLDIDDRAAQLAYFTVMMKAREYDRRFFERAVQPNIYAIHETNSYDMDTMNYLMTAFVDAKEYGSILRIEARDYSRLRDDLKRNSTRELALWQPEGIAETDHLARQAEALSQKYHVVATNPPYMGSSGMGAKLGNFVRRNYPDSKSDLFAVFIERVRDMLIHGGYQAMITQQAWMFLSSYEKLRAKIRREDTVNMIHLGARAFEEIGGEVVQTVSFVLQNCRTSGRKGVYVRLVDPATQQAKEDMFLSGQNRYTARQDDFAKIPGAPVAYWVSGNMLAAFGHQTMSNYGSSCIGMRTGDNERFLRLWHEVSFGKIGFGCHDRQEAENSGCKWFPYCKGGPYRKWYGNNDYVVNWENDGYEIKEHTREIYPQLGNNLGWKISNENFYFRPGLTWSGIGVRGFGVRSYPQGMIFDSGANSYFVYDEANYYYFAGLLNCTIINDMVNIINPTINTGCGVIAKLPAILREDKRDEITALVQENINLSRADWDSSEISWDFQTHPLIRITRENSLTLISDSFSIWEEECNTRFTRLQRNEEQLNRIFTEIYGLNDEIAPEVPDRDITVRRADRERDVKSLVSYAVGCMFGRYSLDFPGLAYAGGEWDSGRFRTFQPCRDGILAVHDEDYYADDIVSGLAGFVEAVWGSAGLEANLSFIADSLGTAGRDRTPLDAVRAYFMNGFYADHLKAYQKRPIYWQFDAGKKNSFKCLMYIHRYRPDTAARIRVSYVHYQQMQYRNAMTAAESAMKAASDAGKSRLERRMSSLRAKAGELSEYEEKIHHFADMMIRLDPDDGVRHNYELFAEVLAGLK